MVDIGIDGFKLDECDGSDLTKGWSFPDYTQFSSGIDGKQIHVLFEILYQQAILRSFEEIETLSEVRSSGVFAASYPFVLYICMNLMIS
ncbi:hypothetical protein INF28_10450 [Oscillospiraceae bacterium DSM 107454]|uniref:Alpha-galactosidase n=1 Tax=Ructibacterium gallinarum TaxID=2779355 RepID=A0A9D5M7B5_9FIRM|nr:hypothetical protein [Ructibacterium gallinarum]MBE5040879.1 hypothetical protein [Ructibacterium gallinarum]